MNQPRKNLADSILARAELFRRGMLFDGVPALQPDLEMPAAPAPPGDSGSQPVSAVPEGAAGSAAPAAVPGAAAALTAGAVAGNTPLETILQP